MAASPSRLSSTLSSTVSRPSGVLSDDSVTISVFRNGDAHTEAKRVVLNKRRLRTPEQVLRAIADAVPLTTGTIKKLYDLRGKRVDDLLTLAPMMYIGCGAEPCKPFGRCPYPLPESDAYLATLSDAQRTPPPPSAVVVVQRSRRVAASERVRRKPGVTVWVYRNSDENEEPHRVTVNARLYPSMARLFASLDRTVRLVEGRVTSLVELTSGVAIESLDDLVDGFCYAACGGSVPFRLVAYRPIPRQSEPLSPTEHALHASHAFGSSARRNAVAKARNILVFVNGSREHMGEVVSVVKRSFRTLSALLTYLSGRLGLVSGVRRLVTVGGGAEITRIEDVVDGGMYVACGPEPYRDIEYPVPDLEGGDADAGDEPQIDDGFAYLDGAVSPGALVVVVPDRIEPRLPPRSWIKH